MRWEGFGRLSPTSLPYIQPAKFDCWMGCSPPFAEISVSMKEPQIHLAQNMGWVVGIERVQGKSKNGDAVSFTAFTTNVYEKRDGRWLMVLHTTSRVPQ